MSSASFKRMARVAFTTRRTPAIAGGKRGAPAPYLVDAAQRCTPLDPADAGGKGERVQRLILESPVQLLECFVDGDLDIREGDILVADGRELAVRAQGPWEWRGGLYRYLIVEDLQT